MLLGPAREPCHHHGRCMDGHVANTAQPASLPGCTCCRGLAGDGLRAGLILLLFRILQHWLSRGMSAFTTWVISGPQWDLVP